MILIADEAKLKKDLQAKQVVENIPYNYFDVIQ